jgi:outer membrane protein TolC
MHESRAVSHRPVLAVVVSAYFSFFIGCSTTHYKEAADQEVYQTISEKVPAVPGTVEDFDIEGRGEIDLEGLPVNNDLNALFLGTPPRGEVTGTLLELMESEVGAGVVSLEKALEIAFLHSRDYQAQKEGLYLQALSLTLDRYQFQPMFSAGASADYIFTSRDVTATAFRSDVSALTGSAGDMFRAYEQAIREANAVGPRQNGDATRTVREEAASGSFSVGVDRLLATGGRFAVDLTTNLFRFVSGSPSQESASSALIASFQQPLLRGRGAAATEFLTQAERDLLYQLRDFTRFRQTFSVRVASSYYRVLQSRDSVRNQHRGLNSVAFSLEREQAFMEAGLRTPGQVAQLRQNFLDRDAALTRAVVAYRNNLDDFKLLLGLPVSLNLMLDDAELDELSEIGLVEPKIDLHGAIEVALATRLDLYTQEDLVYDAERRIKVAANRLAPDLNLVASGRVNTEPGNRPTSFDFDRSQWTIGLDLDLPLNRMSERNNYRRALITYEVAARNLELSRDQVILQVRDDWRTLESARKDYEISQLSLQLSRDRVEEEEIRSELGQGIIRDLVEAQDALTAAETQLTNAIVSYTISLLDLWRDIGILYIKPNGQWEEIGNV